MVRRVIFILPRIPADGPDVKENIGDKTRGNSILFAYLRVIRIVRLDDFSGQIITSGLQVNDTADFSSNSIVDPCPAYITYFHGNIN